MDIIETMRKEMPITELSFSEETTLREFSVYWLDYLLPNIKKNTLNKYRRDMENHILRVFQSRKLIDITSEDVQLFALSLKKGVGIKAPLSAKTIHNIHGVCSATRFQWKALSLFLCQV